MKARQHEESLSALKRRFQKNMNRHKGIEWAKVEAKLEANPEKLWSLNEMERTGGDPDVVGYDKGPTSIFFMTVPRKVRKAAEAFAMTAKDWSRGKNTDQTTMLSIWLLPWVSSF